MSRSPERRAERLNMPGFGRCALGVDKGHTRRGGVRELVGAPGEVLLDTFEALRLVALRSTELVRGWFATDDRTRDIGTRWHGVRAHALTCGSRVDKLSAG